jgi:uncharacterized membrane protein
MAAVFIGICTLNKNILAFACVNSIITGILFVVLIAASGSTITEFMRAIFSAKDRVANMTVQQSHIINWMLHFQPIVVMVAFMQHGLFVVRLNHVLACLVSLLAYIAAMGRQKILWQYCLSSTLLKK